MFKVKSKKSETHTQRILSEISNIANLRSHRIGIEKKTTIIVCRYLLSWLRLPLPVTFVQSIVCLLLADQ